MSKRYFGKKSRWEPRLFVIMGAVVAVFLAVLVAPYLLSRTRDALPALVSPGMQDPEGTLAEANALFEQGALDQAEQVLRSLVRGRDPVYSPRAVVLQADIERLRDRNEEALQLLSDAFAMFQGSPEYPLLAARKARQLEYLGRGGEARDIYESLRDHAPPEQRAVGLLGLGRLVEADGDLVAARDLYRSAVEDASWGSPVWEEAVEEMGRLNVKLIFSPMETPESRHYTVESGDSLINIGVKLNTTQGLLMTANNITDPSRLNLGQRLKYTPKDFYIIIERSTCNLYLFDNRGLFKRYRVGLGKPGNETTLGSYVLGTKQKDPVWFKPGAGPIAAGAPDNELGTRWMPMEPVGEGLPRDLGIHGTIAPDTIGDFSSKGCARMHNHDVEELYDLVVRSTPVDVVEVYRPGGAVEDPEDVPDQRAEAR